MSRTAAPALVVAWLALVASPVALSFGGEVALSLGGEHVGALPEEDSAPAARIAPPGFPSDLWPWVSSLDSPDWRERERATRELVRTRRRWQGHLPAGWTPVTAEARWRWRWIRERIDDLDGLEGALERRSAEGVSGTVHRLQAEIGSAVEEVLRRILRGHPRPRVRQRALELLVELRPIDLLGAISTAAYDPSPWVRRSYYSAVAERDRPRLLERVRGDLTAGLSTPLAVEAARAVRVHQLWELTPLLRREWRQAAPACRWEMGLALARDGGPDELELFFEMAESGDYRMVLPGLRALEPLLKPSHLPRYLAATLTSRFSEVRHRGGEFARRRGGPDLALEMLPFLEDDDPCLRQFAARCIIEWRAEDFYGDLVAAISAWPAEERAIEYSQGAFRDLEPEGRIVPATVRESAREP